jgi:hypothetical protein
MLAGPRYSIRYLLAEMLLLAVALGSTRMLFVDGPLTQGRIALVFPLFVCLGMSISGLVGEWKPGAYVGLVLSILAAFGLSVGAGR